uniref:Si:ch211-27e6.1 n=1 Tax=Erpetoichthys calabaricus TaxID=27687 RepID=A0A8C4RPX2_ERPCA
EAIKKANRMSGYIVLLKLYNTLVRPHLEHSSTREGPEKKTEYHLTEISTLFLFCRYNIKALIGRGSFSRVVRVEHRATKQPFAIKIIETKAKEGREVCESELNVLRRVSHRNIIQLMEVFESHERVYMVMELATGGELFDRIIAKGSFTERDATRVLQMVLDSIKYLHSLGITHRDLKPENLLYYHPGVDSKILVTDFGLASSGNKAGDWLMRTTCGTPEYIAPEILLRKPYTNAVDAWALGVITYIMLSGSMPFEEENPWGPYDGGGNCPACPCINNNNIYFYTKDFITRLLTIDPNDRMTASQALKHPWIVTMAASSSMKNLHRSISQNLMRRAAPTHRNKSTFLFVNEEKVRPPLRSSPLRIHQMTIRIFRCDTRGRCRSSNPADKHPGHQVKAPIIFFISFLFDIGPQ